MLDLQCIVPSVFLIRLKLKGFTDKQIQQKNEGCNLNIRNCGMQIFVSPQGLQSQTT